MLHQVRANQEAEIEAAAWRSIETTFDETNLSTHEEVLATSALKIQRLIWENEMHYIGSLPDPKTFRGRRAIRKMAKEQFPQDRARIIGEYMLRRPGALYHHPLELHTPIVLETKPEVVDVDDKAEARISFGWVIESDLRPRPPDSPDRINIYYVTKSESNSVPQTWRKKYGILVWEKDGRPHKVALHSDETNGYITPIVQKFTAEHPGEYFLEDDVLLPPEFYRQPIGILGLAVQELEGKRWHPKTGAMLK